MRELLQYWSFSISNTLGLHLYRASPTEVYIDSCYLSSASVSSSNGLLLDLSKR